MKKSGFTLAGLMVILTIVLLTGIAMAATPWQESSTTATTSVSFTNSANYVGKTLTAVLVNNASKTNTVTITSSGVSHQVATEVSSATDKMIAITNTPIVFKGDIITVTSNDTNAHIVVIQGTQDP